LRNAQNCLSEGGIVNILENISKVEIMHLSEMNSQRREMQNQFNRFRGFFCFSTTGYRYIGKRKWELSLWYSKINLQERSANFVG
jgi:hypothetical protein